MRMTKYFNAFLFVDSYFRRTDIATIGASHDEKLAWFKHQFTLTVVVAEHLTGNRKFDGLLLSGFQMDATESLQLLDRSRDGSFEVANVELHYLVSVAIT